MFTFFCICMVIVLLPAILRALWLMFLLTAAAICACVAIVVGLFSGSGGKQA